MWADAAEDAKVIGWVRELWGALQPFSSGGLYVNYEAAHDAGRVQAAYSPTSTAAGGLEEPVRPHKSLPTQPEHSANGIREPGPAAARWLVH